MGEVRGCGVSGEGERVRGEWGGERVSGGGESVSDRQQRTK